MPQRNSRNSAAIPLLVGAFAILVVFMAGPAFGAQSKPKFKFFHIGSSAAAAVGLPEEREVNGTPSGKESRGTIEGTLTSVNAACIRSIEVSGSYETAGMGGRRNFGPVTSDAEGHWSAELTRVYPEARERRITLYIVKKLLPKHMVCGTGFGRAETLKFPLTF